jgi:hypothetical protein
VKEATRLWCRARNSDRSRCSATRNVNDCANSCSSIRSPPVSPRSCGPAAAWLKSYGASSAWTIIPIIWDESYTASGSARRSRNVAPANGTKRRSRAGVRTIGRESKKSCRRGAVLVFLDESGFRLQPLNRRTWAPVGSRRQQVVSQRHDRLSVPGSLSVLPSSGKIRQHFAIQERNVRTPDLMRYLGRLRRKHR